MKIRLRRLRVRHRTRVCRTPPQAAAQLLQPYGNRQRFLGDRRRLHAERRHQYRRAVPRSGPVRSQCRRRGGTVPGQQRLYDVHVAQHAHQQGAVRPRRPVRRDPTAVRRAVPRGTAPQHHQSQHASTYRQPAVVRRTDPQGREPRRQIAVNHRMAAFMESYSMCCSR